MLPRREIRIAGNCADSSVTGCSMPLGDRYFTGTMPVLNCPAVRKVRKMSRPTLGPRDRVRVEFRLPREVAEAAYRCADDWDVSLSEAGSRLIESGYTSLRSQPKMAALANDSRREASSGLNQSTNPATDGGDATRRA